MNLPRSKTLFFALALTLLTSPAIAEIYKWTDADGKTHYSQTPPPDQEAQDIGDEIALSTGKALQSSTAGSGDEDKAETQKNNSDEAIQKAREEGKRKAMQLTEQCKHIHETLKKMHANPIVNWQGDDGEQRILSSDERKKKITEIEKNLGQFCNPDGSPKVAPTSMGL